MDMGRTRQKDNPALREYEQLIALHSRHTASPPEVARKAYADAVRKAEELKLACETFSDTASLTSGMKVQALFMYAAKAARHGSADIEILASDLELYAIVKALEFGGKTENILILAKQLGLEPVLERALAVVKYSLSDAEAALRE